MVPINAPKKPKPDPPARLRAAATVRVFGWILLNPPLLGPGEEVERMNHDVLHVGTHGAVAIERP